MHLAFAPSLTPTLGCELETTIVDLQTYTPQPVVTEIVTAAQGRVARGVVTLEMYASSLEMNTGICSSVSEVRADLSAVHAAVKPELESRGVGLLAMGLHPRSTYDDLVLSPGDRPRHIVDRLQAPGQRMHATGIHVHVGVPGEEESLRVCRQLNEQVPVLVALAASSPFDAGLDTGLSSTRMSLWDPIPRSGAFPDLRSWSEFEAHVGVLTRAGSIESLKDTYWDVRPRPDFGTVEIRVCDAIADLDDLLALVALSQCLVVRALEDDRPVQSALLVRENRWRAIRYGHAAELLVGETGEVQPLAARVEELVVSLEHIARDLDCVDALNRCVPMARGEAPHQNLRDIASAKGLDDVMESQLIRW